MKNYSTHAKSSELEFHHQIQFRFILGIPLWPGSYSSSEGCGQCILISAEKAQNIIHACLIQAVTLFWKKSLCVNKKKPFHKHEVDCSVNYKNNCVSFGNSFYFTFTSSEMITYPWQPVLCIFPLFLFYFNGNIPYTIKINVPLVFSTFESSSVRILIFSSFFFYLLSIFCWFVY